MKRDQTAFGELYDRYLESHAGGHAAQAPNAGAFALKPRPDVQRLGRNRLGAPDAERLEGGLYLAPGARIGLF